MGKNKKANLPTAIDKYTNETIEFDSAEEKQFYNWLIELRDAGLVEKWDSINDIYQPASFKLFDTAKYNELSKGKLKECTLLREHIYSPDFKLTFTKKFYETFPREVLKKYFKFLPISEDLSDISPVYIDIKGTFNSNAGDRVFSINQKWVYLIHKQFINKIVPEKLFADTFVPETERYTEKTKKLREKYVSYKHLSDFLAK